MKKALFTLLGLAALTACQTTTGSSLQPGEVYGTNIGSILAQEARLQLSDNNISKMNSEIEKALYFSGDGLTTKWYAGTSARVRPLHDIMDRRDRTCRRFRHSVMIDDQWRNGTAIACREQNVAWYLIENQWDKRSQRPNNDQDKPWRRDENAPKGNWENLSGEMGSSSSGIRW